MTRPLRVRLARGRLGPDAGSATVELAAAIPLLVAVTLAMVGVIGLARDQVLAQGAAREAAREAAMGGDRARPGPCRGGTAGEAAVRRAAGDRQRHHGRRPRARTTPRPLRQRMSYPTA